MITRCFFRCVQASIQQFPKILSNRTSELTITNLKGKIFNLILLSDYNVSKPSSKCHPHTRGLPRCDRIRDLMTSITNLLYNSCYTTNLLCCTINIICYLHMYKTIKEKYYIICCYSSGAPRAASRAPCESITTSEVYQAMI